MGLIFAAGVVLAALCGYALRGGKPKMTQANQPAVAQAAATAKSDVVQGKFLSTLVTLKNNGLTHLSDLLKHVWTNDKAAIEQTAIIEAEHLAQGGPGLVEADLAALFAKTLAAKLADPGELQSLLATIVSTLGANHPALLAFATSILPAKPAAPGPALAIAPKT